MDDGFVDEFDVSMADFGSTGINDSLGGANNYEHQMSLTEADFKGVPGTDGVRTVADMQPSFFQQAVDFATPNTFLGWLGYALAPWTMGGSIPLTTASRGLGALDWAVGKDFENVKDLVGDFNIPNPSTLFASTPPPPPDEKKNEQLVAPSNVTPNKPSVLGPPVGRVRGGANENLVAPPPNMGGGGDGGAAPINQQVAALVDPAALAPVAQGPSFAPAPTTGRMGLPEGFDPTQAGFSYTNFARTAQRGGLMDLPNQARNVAAQGRGGDSMLVHMRPDEVAGLQALGGVTRNPQTGLPEHFLGSTLGSLAGLALMPFTGGMVNPFVMQGLGAGVGQFAESKMRGEENALQKGLTSGLMAGLGSYGLNKLGTAATNKGLDTVMQGGREVAQEAGMLSGAEKFFPNMEQFRGVEGMEGLKSLGQAAEPLMGAAGLGLGAGAVTDMMMPYVPPMRESGKYKNTAKLTPQYERTARDLSGMDLSRYGMGPEGRFFSTTRLQEGGLAEVGAMMEEAGPDANIVAEEVTAQAVSAVRGDHPEPEKAVTEYISMFGEESFGRLREMVIQEMQVESAGGAQEIAAEGMISGPGAGRDDLIRGSIEGEQELRVSDGEFIVPADVVSGIGDGSSDAGAKRLYSMLDRVRQTRTGTKQQPSRVDEQAMLPA